MRKLLVINFILLTIFILPVSAQLPKNHNKPLHIKPAIPASRAAIDRKYPSLLWEISGNGLSKPSYLFGTMHISDKLVFHLGDSFYNAIKGVDVVALETNPETWQDDYSKSVLFRGRSGNM